MEVTVKKVEITLPEVDMALLKELAKKFGWNIGRKKSVRRTWFIDLANAFLDLPYLWPYKPFLP